jgi:hypothetical protein
VSFGLFAGVALALVGILVLYAMSVWEDLDDEHSNYHLLGTVHRYHSQPVGADQADVQRSRTVIPHLKYAKYVLWHKLYVFLECLKRGIPLRGLLHDLSKLRPDEWRPYARYFYGGGSTKDTKQEFHRAWLKHIHRNSHHWQFHILKLDDGGEEVMYMPRKDMIEMLCDWIGAGKALNMPDTAGWYMKNRHIIKLHPLTRRWIEIQLGIPEFPEAIEPEDCCHKCHVSPLKPNRKNPKPG